MGLTTENLKNRIGAYVADYAGCPVEIERFERLSGGAIQENWALDLTVSGGAWAGSHKLVLRRDSQSTVAASHGRRDEFELLKAAHAAGVTVPEPCFCCDDPKVIGGPFFLMHRVEGVAAGFRLVKTGPDPGLARQLGRDLARIHTIRPPRDDLEFLGPAPAHPAGDTVARFRRYLDELAAPHPVLEWGLDWLERNAPDREEVVLCHRDYRTGNYMVAGGLLTGVLDWEFAGWSDPLEDIGWFFAKCWRFGAWDREAGGIAGREDFLTAYETESGRQVDRDAVPYWEVMAHVHWAVVARQQAERHVSGEEPSLELALTAHVVPELELEILSMTKEG